MTAQGEISIDSIARICALLALDALPHAPAFHTIEAETVCWIKRCLNGEAHENATAQIKAALLTARTLNAPKLAAQIRFSVVRDGEDLELTRQHHNGPHKDHHGPEIILVSAPEFASTIDVLAALGFETYENLPTHLVTPNITPATPPVNDLQAIQGMLILLGLAAGLGPHLAQVASIGALMEFWRQGYERTANAEFVASTAEIFDFLDDVVIVDILKATTVEAHGGSTLLFSVADLPLQVLEFIGSRGFNRAVNAEESIEALGLGGAGEISGALLLERDRSMSAEDPRATNSEGTDV